LYLLLGLRLAYQSAPAQSAPCLRGGRPLRLTSLLGWIRQVLSAGRIAGRDFRHLAVQGVRLSRTTFRRARRYGYFIEIAHLHVARQQFVELRGHAVLGSPRHV